jgi:hypothetical protein
MIAYILSPNVRQEYYPRPLVIEQPSHQAGGKDKVSHGSRAQLDF